MTIVKKLLEHTRRPDISFHRNGTIRITARVARMLSLLPGDAINIAITDAEFLRQREQSGACSGSAGRSRQCGQPEYLLFAVRHQDTSHRYEAQCYRSKRGGGENYCANSVRLCRALFNSIGVKSERVSFMAGEAIMRNTVRYVPIITLHPL